MKIKKIDNIDRKILYAMDSSGIYSLDDVAKYAKISKQNLNYRIKKLIDMNILKGYSVELNLSKLDVVLGRLYLKFRGSRTLHTSRLKELLRKRPLYFWSAAGEFDVFLALDISKESKHISELLNYKFSGDILRSRLAIFQEVLSLDRGYLVDKPPSKVWYVIDTSSRPVELSTSAEKVLASVLNNPDPYTFPLRTTSIMQSLGLNFRTVKRSLTELKKNGIIQRIKPTINLRPLGINHYKMTVYFSRKVDVKEIKKMEKDIYWASGSIYINKVLGTEPSIEGEFEMTPQQFDLFIERIEEKYSDYIDEIKQMIFRQQLVSTSFVSPLTEPRS
jgi:DNA-binding Lrp family transcriptional regulator